MTKPAEVVQISPDLILVLTDQHVQLLTKPADQGDHAVALTENYVTALHQTLGGWLRSDRGRT